MSTIPILRAPTSYSHATISTIAAERHALPELSSLYDTSNVKSSYKPLQKATNPILSPEPIGHKRRVKTQRIRASPNISKSIDIAALRPHFDKPLIEVAQYFGVCSTLMKKICRKNGVYRWPYRQLKGLRAQIDSLEKTLESSQFHDNNSVCNLQNDIQRCKKKLLAIYEEPTSIDSGFSPIENTKQISIQQYTKSPVTVDSFQSYSVLKLSPSLPSFHVFLDRNRVGNTNKVQTTQPSKALY